MTSQGYHDLHDDAERLVPEVVESMQERAHDRGDAAPWRVEYEIPAQTSGWVYVGNPGAASVTHHWADQWPDATEAVVLHETPTHPRDETKTVVEVSHLDDWEKQTRDAHDVFFAAEGQPYRTPLYVRRRLFWEAVEAAIDWMTDHPQN